jgi:hypothetical protein
MMSAVLAIEVCSRVNGAAARLLSIEMRKCRSDRFSKSEVVSASGQKNNFWKSAIKKSPREEEGGYGGDRAH